MLKINNKIFFLLLISAAFVFSGCRLLRDGTPPEKIIEINESSDRSVKMSEAINLISTELAVNVLPSGPENIRISFEVNSNSEAIAGRLYSEMAMFVPIQKVASDGDFAIAVIYAEYGEKDNILHVVLYDQKRRIVWRKQLAIREQ